MTMKLRKTVMGLRSISLLAVLLISTVSGFRRTSIQFNSDTGGYEAVSYTHLTLPTILLV